MASCHLPCIYTTSVDSILPFGRDVPDQTHALWDTRAFVVGRIPLVGRGQRDLLLGQTAAQKVTHAGKAGGIDAHAEADAALVQRGG